MEKLKREELKDKTVGTLKEVISNIDPVLFLCATLLSVLYGFIVSKATDLVPNYIVLAVSTFVLSAVSQVGDLIASLIKREYGVKDYGKIFPGHGGVMDRFDSVLSITTILMAICLIFKPFA